MASVWDGWHARKADEYGADRQLEGAIMGMITGMGQGITSMAGQGAGSMGNIAQGQMSGQANAFDRYAGGVGGMTGDYMKGTGGNYKTFTDGTNRYQDNLADLGRTGAGMFRDYSTNLSNLYGAQSAERANLYNAYTQPFAAGLTAAGNIGSAGLGATGAASNAALGGNASMNQAFQNMLAMNSQGANNAYGSIGASRNQGAANIAQAMAGVGQEALRSRGQILTGAGGALEGITRGIADMRSNIGSNTALADANLGGALATATGTISAGASPFTVTEDRFRQNNSFNNQSSGQTSRERDSTTRRSGTDIDLDGLFSGLFGEGGGGGTPTSTTTTITGPGGSVIGTGGFSSTTSGLPAGVGGGGGVESTTRKFDDTDVYNERDTTSFNNQNSFDTGSERYTKGPSPLLGRIVDDAFGNLQGVGMAGFDGIQRSREMADDMSPFDRGYEGIDAIMRQADDQSVANTAYQQLGGALGTLYDNPANDYVADTFNQTRFDGGNYLTQGMNENARIYDQTLFDIQNQVQRGYGNLNDILGSLAAPTASSPDQYLGRMDAGYAAGLENLGYTQQEMAARQNMLAPMYDISNQRMANAYGMGLGMLGGGYDTARSSIDASGAAGRAGVQQSMAQGQAGINQLMQDVKNAGYLMSPEEKAQQGYKNKQAKVEQRDKYNEFMRQRRIRQQAGRM